MHPQIMHNELFTEMLYNNPYINLYTFNKSVYHNKIATLSQKQYFKQIYSINDLIVITENICSGRVYSGAVIDDHQSHCLLPSIQSKNPSRSESFPESLAE